MHTSILFSSFHCRIFTCDIRIVLHDPWSFGHGIFPHFLIVIVWQFLYRSLRRQLTINNLVLDFGFKLTLRITRWIGCAKQMYARERKYPIPLIIWIVVDCMNLSIVKSRIAKKWMYKLKSCNNLRKQFQNSCRLSSRSIEIYWNSTIRTCNNSLQFQFELWWSATQINGLITFLCDLLNKSPKLICESKCSCSILILNLIVFCLKQIVFKASFAATINNRPL